MLSRTGQWCLVVSLVALPLSMPASISTSTTPTTSMSTSRANVTPIIETMKQLANQLMHLNASSHLTFDTRTPPKFREQTRREHVGIVELGHPGLAEPVDDEALMMEEINKKMTFYKVEKPTTDSGLSTWILLSGQPSTNKPTKKPLAQLKSNATATNDDRVIKPIFKRKSTTLAPVVSTAALIRKTSTVPLSTIKANATTTEKPDKTTKVNKIKPTLLSGNKTTQAPKKVTSATTTDKPTKTTSKADPTATNSTKKAEFVKVPTKSSLNAGDLQPEAKEGALDLTATTTDKKNKLRSTTLAPKKKKNKHRRKKPIAEDKMDSVNATKLPTKIKERPISTQLYHYLSREVMPTVGVGLVGLMVTAGLASYFLYPFGPLRRTYEIDRKDKGGGYHYTDEYNGGIAEEEAIGKVIAGMPANSYYNTRSQNSRNTYGLNYNDFNGGTGGSGGGGYPGINTRFRNVDQRYMEGTVEAVALDPIAAYQTEEVIIGSPKQQSVYVNHKPTYDQHFDVDSVGKEHIPQDAAATDVPTPAVVPEHGPRTLDKETVFVVESIPAHAPRRRRKRHAAEDIENEIDLSDKTTLNPSQPSDTTKDTPYDITTSPDDFFTHTPNPIIEKTETIFGLIKDLIYLKLRMGLQMLHERAESLTRYFKNVQERIDATYRNVNQTIRYS